VAGRIRPDLAEHAERAPRSVHPPAATALLLVVLALFVGGGLYSGWLFLSNVREILSAPSRSGGTRIIEIPEVIPIDGISIPGVKPVAKPVAKPVPTAAPATPTPAPEEALPIWDGKERVTILLLGLDQREEDRGIPARSDTMVLLTMDPLNLTAGMLSIPRDLWVPIPGYENNKINVAHFLGEQAKEGDGPELARRTVQKNFGVHIHYVARVDFKGFERLIDQIGGVTIDVDRALLDNEYPNERVANGITRLFIPPGPQRMNGLQALRYARSRHADSDFGRNLRQQRVLQAAREQVLQAGIIPKLPSMFAVLNQSIWTSVPWFDMLALANLGRRVDTGKIMTRQIDGSLIDDVNGDGTVLVPSRSRIRPVVQELFYDPALKRDAARIEVLNGTARDGLATTTRAGLIDRGFDVVRADSAPRANYTSSAIVDNSGGAKRATVDRLRAELKLPAAAVQSTRLAGSTADVTVIIGSDFRPLE
jgi:LCP family protein required for cell wall assembly